MLDVKYNRQGFDIEIHPLTMTS